MVPGVGQWQKCKLFIFSLAVPCVPSSTWDPLRVCLSSSSRRLISHGSLAQQAALRRGSPAWMRGGLEIQRPGADPVRGAALLAYSAHWSPSISICYSSQAGITLHVSSTSKGARIQAKAISPAASSPGS